MKRLKGAFPQDHPRYDGSWSRHRDGLYLWALRNWEPVWDTYRNDADVRQGLNRKGDIWRVILSVAKVLFDEEAYQVLLAQAKAPEPDFDEEDIPEEYEPIIDALDDLKAKGIERVKATFIKETLGEKLAPQLRSDKAFVDALRDLEETQKITVKPFGKGKTTHVFFREKPQPPLPPPTFIPIM